MSANPRSAERPGVLHRFAAWLPDAVDARVRVFGWLSFLAEVIIVGTGGAVRLTDSGLGCAWPLCTPDSLAPTPAMGIHSFIEFGNRMMSGVVGILALVVLILVWRMRRTRRDLWWLALTVVLGVLLQAIVGGITVRTDLNAGIVAFHYVASVVLVCVTAAFLVRMHTVPGPRRLAVPRWFAILTHITTFVLALALVFGVLTTASGPHSGDADVIRHGFDATLMAHIHSFPGYALFGLTLILFLTAWVKRLRVQRWLTVLVCLEVVQIGVGVLQARTELPPLLVGIHMILAALTAAAMTAVVLNLKEPMPADSEVASPVSAAAEA
ncbi:COX15/CtaA family protein [Microbacterium sp. ASV49]|uniref:COX15/CtaA family protein n=1 Tax=Microbacterium candidum TaxID=3041922 RepID=A0ABT7MZL2_9MICO|nr:COX15/CtaA family protein [Microbacterium sp. ASV49]MDL9979896.1 COX15/CtaA family protein [Microbacterium sp. ASV49]